MNSVSYVIITPARNEGFHLQKTIDSVAAQTVRPQKWIIVDDGSKDDTRLLAQAAARRYDWIGVVQRIDRGRREAGGGVIATFYDGYKLVANHPWQYIVKLDGDLSFGPTYFQECLEQFQKDPQLGIGGGTCCLEINGKAENEFPEDPGYHVRGPTKIYRRECWMDIGGLIQAPGWDGVDEIKANMHGWRTCGFKGITLIHHRPTGAAYGIWTDAVKAGLANYITGYHPVFMLCKCARRLCHKPYGIGSLALWTGFMKGYWRRIPQVADKEMIRYVRRQQWRALTFRSSLWSTQ
jgi:glycosyltransferase involved in cell wall biosynthesis